MSYLVVAKASQLADGAMMAVQLRGRELLLVRAGDRFYAADNRCPHMGGNLSRGRLDETVVTCPRHGSRFDVTDGHVVRWLRGAGLLSQIGTILKRARPLATYNVKVENGNILVDI